MTSWIAQVNRLLGGAAHVPHAVPVLAAIALLWMLLASPVKAAFPGANGKIAYSLFNNEGDFYATCTHVPGGSRNCFSGDGFGDRLEISAAWSPDGAKLAITSTAIYVVNADGTNPVQLMPPDRDFFPTWSPDGSKLVFESDRDDDTEIYVVNADGTGATRITNSPGADYSPVWSPDGRKIAFSSVRSGNFEIWVMNPDGSGATKLTNDAAADTTPSWSPDGEWLAFSSGRDGNNEVYKMRADGSGVTRLTNDPSDDIHPIWSPDGTKVAFASKPICAGCPYGIAVTGVDGSGRTSLVLLGPDEELKIPFDWQPLPVTSYPRPKGATPVSVSLVPAANQCTAPNETHAAPPSSGSCSPVGSSSPNLTVGVGDFSPAFAKSTGRLRLDVDAGNLTTPADEADLNLTFKLTNVMNRSDLSDYTGELRASTRVRITDHQSTPVPGGAGTAEDFPYGFTIPCAATADTTLGGLCQLQTTADTLVGGSINEGSLSNWSLGRVEVYDGGPDGDAETSADNSLLEVQGIFVP